MGISNSGKFKNKYDPSNGFVFMPNHSLILSHSRDLPEELTVKIGSTPTKVLHSREGESWLFILTPRYRYNRLALPGAVAPSLPSSPTRKRQGMAGAVPQLPELTTAPPPAASRPAASQPDLLGTQQRNHLLPFENPVLENVGGKRRAKWNTSIKKDQTKPL